MHYYSGFNWKVIFKYDIINLEVKMRNIVLEISYNGKDFCGWQVQKNKATVQGTILFELTKLLQEEITLTASGRTDTGVSAIKQVANFFTSSNISCKELVGRLNVSLPQSIKILNAYEKDSNFSARYSAKSKTYAYSFYLSKTEIPYLDTFATQFKQDVNMNIFKKELKSLVGEHNFTSFCASNSVVTNFVREIFSAELKKNGNVYTVIISGNGFLYNMIRIIIGTLIDISCGKLNNNISKIIELKNRQCAGFTASGGGLVLLDVNY